MSSTTQKAVILSYPGATAGGLLNKLKNDPKFKNINPSHISQFVIFCGNNNVDNILKIPASLQSEFVHGYHIDDNRLHLSLNELTKLTEFLHSWTATAKVNVLPRQSTIRNIVINNINHHIKQLSIDKDYVEIVSTEKHRSLFSINGYRKNMYFLNSSTDNVHLNNTGLARLTKYLKYFIHHN